MNAIQQGVIALMKSALTGEKIALPEQFDIEQAYPFLRGHGIMAMGYVGALRCGIDKTIPVMQKLRRDYAACLLNSQQQMAQIERLYQAFEENGIDYMPLKGCNLKKLYPSHELRGMSDADILIRQDCYDVIRSVLMKMGFEEQYETDHELVWRSKELCLELHKQLVPCGNKDYHRYYRNGWQFAKQQSGCRHSMSVEDEFVFIFTHFAKHYRNGGVGCRQVVDLWVYQQCFSQLNMSYIRKELAVLGLDAFFENVQVLLAVWFGETETNKKTDFMTEVIFLNGNWGTVNTHAIAELIRNRRGKASVWRGKFRWFMKRVFPSKKQLSYKYPLLKKWPVFLPIVWIWRSVYTVFCQRDKLRGDYRKMGKISSHQIEEQEQALAYVGLYFGE